MNRRTVLSFVVASALLAMPAVILRPAVLQAANEKGSEQLLNMIVKLIGDDDKDFRAAGLDQVRSGAKGTAATRLFAEQLARIKPAAQVSLLSALSDRGDTAARPAVVDLLKTTGDENVRVAAIAALGNLGEPADLHLLVEALASKSTPEQAAARTSLSQLRGNDISSSLAAELGTASPNVKASLIEVLATRRAKDAIPAMVAATVSDNAQVRSAAMKALGQIGTADQLAAMLPGVLKAAKGGERDSAEKNVALVCSRIDNENQRADALLKALSKVSPADRDQLLSLVGRVGGKKLINYVAEIATGSDPARRALGIDALSKWPDASVADKLLEITKTSKDPALRDQAFQGYVKVSATRDKRSDKQRLDRMKQAMKIAATPKERLLVINRSRTAYDVDTLRFVLPYLDQPDLAQAACETIVELAHHREVRDPNKAEFDKALDRVIATSKNATVVERANRYKRGETWSRQ